MERARALCQLPELTADNAEEWLETFHAKEQEATESLLQLEQKLSVADAAHSQFEQAYQLVVNIAGEVSRSEAWQTARELLRDWPSQQHLAERVQPLRMRLSELEQRLRAQQDAERLLQEFCKRQGNAYQPEELEALQRELESQVEELSLSVSDAGERRMAMRQELEQLKLKIQELTARAPVWLAAQDALSQLSEQSGEALEDSRQVTEYMQQLLERERETTVERDEIAASKRAIEAQIERLSQPSGLKMPA